MRSPRAVLLLFAIVLGCNSSGDAPGDWIVLKEGGADAPDGAGHCKPSTCSAQGAECGEAPDGCGNTITCGKCTGSLFCGGAGPNRCGSTPCEKTTCAKQAAECGTLSDGCASTLSCGGCTPPNTCGGAGVANHCGTKASGGGGSTGSGGTGGTGGTGSTAGKSGAAGTGGTNTAGTGGDAGACVLYGEFCEGKKCCEGNGKCVYCSDSHHYCFYNTAECDQGQGGAAGTGNGGTGGTSSAGTGGTSSAGTGGTSTNCAHWGDGCEGIKCCSGEGAKCLYCPEHSAHYCITNSTDCTDVGG